MHPLVRDIGRAIIWTLTVIAAISLAAGLLGCGGGDDTPDQATPANPCAANPQACI